MRAFSVRSVSRILASVVATLAASSFAFADAPSSASATAASAAPTASDRETARTLMVQGIAQRKNGDLSGALASFKNADAIMHVTTTALEVAKTEEALGQLIEARDAALAALRVPAKSNEPPVLKDARAQLTALSESIEPRIPSLQITLQGVPAGTTANVQMDGTALAPETLAVARRVDPGHHVIEGAAGDARGRTEVDVAEKESKVATVTFAVPVALAAVAAPTTNEQKHKSDPLVIGEIAGFGLGAIGLVAGGITGFVSLHKSSSLKSECPNNLCPGSVYDSSSFQSDRNSARTMGTISTVSFIAGGVFAAAGATFLVLRSKRHEDLSSTPSASVVVGPGFASGTF